MQVKRGGQSAADMNGKTVGICAGLAAATALVGYCVYFDQKRRSDPDFKKRLKAKRNKTKAEAAAMNKEPASAAVSKMPDFNDQEAVQRYFLQQVQLGETLLAQGALEEGVEHLGMAVAVCGQPHALLGVLQETLPPQIYAMLLQNLDSAQRTVRAHAASTTMNSEKTSTMSADQKKDSLEDLE